MTQGIQYQRIVDRWKAITGGFEWENTHRCCEVIRAGAPECCFQLVDGEDLTFTAQEIRALNTHWGQACSSSKFQPMPGEWQIWRFDRKTMTPAQMTESLKDGWMANTIECASHPLRPIIGAHNRVIGTVAIDGCNTKLALRSYVQRRDEIRDLWQETVDLYGTKPYYVTKSIRKGWTVI